MPKGFSVPALEVLVAPRPGKRNHGRLRLQRGVKLFVIGPEEQEVDAERLLRTCANVGYFLA